MPRGHVRLRSEDPACTLRATKQPTSDLFGTAGRHGRGPYWLDLDKIDIVSRRVLPRLA
jgi:hypothetical protein